ncbi:FxDxF family PEP-CTERM protein [Sandaracinobacteroides saxicola]|uniref:PEP-CTERM sorting domain-containing protein n=1 Tax=Sandaracinobacteroides saxicola TaxID=2759707 RepID=A0A7G5IJQ9_9SPHN|nr:FxDxF family PEP-CTERM protein [Sandaracinobacteroides saxicola]QMW23601.1 PEP-CTERM sorting domain-containing protein [Sandaracinobacteroides saxicola]
MRKLLMAALLAGVASAASATVLIPGTGWQSDQVDAANTDSINSPWTFTLTNPGVFRLTDAFIVGDIYTVSGSFNVASTFFAGPAIPLSNPTADAAWLSADFSHILVPLPAGVYSITIQGNGAGGLPAGFFVQLTQVPEPATWAMMIAGFGLVGLGLRRRRQPVVGA